MKEKKGKSKKTECISTQAVAHFDWHFVGLLRLGLAAVKFCPSIGLWKRRSPVLRLDFGRGEVLSFDWALAPVRLYPSIGQRQQQVVSFDWTKAAVREYLSIGRGLPPGCLFRLTWRKRVEARSFVSY